MKRSPAALALSLTLGGLVLLAACGGAGYWALNGGLYGCGDADHQLANRYSQERMLTTPPRGTRAEGEPQPYCDDDDAVPLAYRDYRSPLPARDLAALYRERAANEDWSPAGSADASVLCFRKEVTGTDAYLAVSLDTGPDEFSVQITKGPYDSCPD